MSMMFRYYFFKEGTRVYDKAELLTYLEAQPFMTLKNDGPIKKAYYNNTVLDFNALFVLNTKSVIERIERLDPKYLDLNIYVEFEVLNNTYKVEKIIDMVEIICRRFGFAVYNEYFENVTPFKRNVLIRAFEVVKDAYKKKYEEEFLTYSRLSKDTLKSIYSFLEIKEQLDDLNDYKILDYIFLKEKDTRSAYVCIDATVDGPFIIPPAAKLVKIKAKNDRGYIYISYQDFFKKISKYLTLVDSRLYDVFMVDEKNYKKVKKIITKTKFDEVVVYLEKIELSNVMDI